MLRVIFLPLFLAVALFPQTGFYQFSIDQDHVTGAADFSQLNTPLRPYDRLYVKGGHFYNLGRDLEPGTGDEDRVRLFGVNMAFGGNFPDQKDAVRIAKRLSRLGVNLVRLHHMDSSPDKDPQTARSILLSTGPYPTLNPAGVARLRAFLDALKAEGIYVNLNLHVGYTFRPEIDRVPAMPGGQRIPTQSKPLHIFHPRMVELQLEFTRKVIDALKLNDDPVLGMAEIDNESSLLEAWQRGSLDRVLLGEYKAELERQWNAWLKTRYRSTEEIRAAWGGAAPKRGLPEGETLEAATIAAVTANEECTDRRADDWLRFLVDRDRAYLRAMRDAVRASAGKLVPIAGTQMGYGGLLNLDSHDVLDYQDNHFYIDHYNFPNRSWDGRDWRIRDASATGSGLAAYLNMAAAREGGKPYTVSEYNQQWPNTHGAEIDPTLSAFAAFQDWDSIMHFAYSHGQNWDVGMPNGFDLNGDWSKWANVGQSAFLFRMGVIRPGRQAVDIPAPEDLRLRAARERRIGNIAPFLASAIGYEPAVAFSHQVRLAKSGGQLPAAAKGPLPGPFRSDTGDLTYDRDGKVFLIHAPRAAGVFGEVGRNRKVTAGAIDVELAAGARGFAAILVTPIDYRPLAVSARILLSTPGYTVGTQPGSQPPRPQKLVNYPGTSDWWTLEKDPAYPDKPAGSNNAVAAPVWMERVESFVTLRTNAGAITVYPLDGRGERLAALGPNRVERVEGGFRIHLQAEGDQASPWYEIIRDR